jgi:HSP20 family protein
MERRNDSLLSNLFDHFINNDEMEKRQFFAMPPANILETEEDFRIEMAVPGFDKSDFNIELEEDLLTITMDKEEKENEKEEYLKREFRFNDFKRVFRLSDKIDKEKIKGHYKNGILQVVIPKKEEVIRNANRSIEVE